MTSDEAVDTDEQTRWLAQWKAAAAALHEQRAFELREMTPAEAWSATEAVLSIPSSTPLSGERRRHSGLVELQRYFTQLRLQ